MREIISYSKDFLTGDVVSEIKHKPDNGVRGEVTVSLFNAENGELIQEAKTENIIPDLFFKEIFIKSFVGGIMGAGDNGFGTRAWFNYLYLTDSDKPETANDQRVDGNVIGYAHRNSAYSGTDGQRGTINLAETKYEVTDSKIRCNFVFDFPTHAANGITESVYWCESDPASKDYMYIGAPIWYRETADDSSGVPAGNARRYYGAQVAMNYCHTLRFTSPKKGFLILDGRSGTIINSTYLQFPESLKQHWVYVPFDLAANDIIKWGEAVKLMNADGNTLNIDSADPVRKYDGFGGMMPFSENGEQVFIGHYRYTNNTGNTSNNPAYGHVFTRIYKWSKTGVLQNFVDFDETAAFKDANNVAFTLVLHRNEGVWLDGCFDYIGYNSRTDPQFNETERKNHLFRVNYNGNVVQNMDVKPKMGNCHWFGARGMDSGNIERRCYVDNFIFSATRLYIHYAAMTGGTAFWQVINRQGNLLEPYRTVFGSYTSGSNYYSPYNILGTDRWLYRYTYSAPSNIDIRNALTSRPIGAHTRLTQAVEKTESNTMKVQYMFEVDLLTFGEDYY